MDVPPSATATQVPILFLQESGIPSSESFAHLMTPFPKLFSFSVCYRLRLARFREESTLMSYALSDDLDNEIRMGEWYMQDVTPTVAYKHVIY